MRSGRHLRGSISPRGLSEPDPTAGRRSFLLLCLVPALVVLVLVLIYPLFYNVFLSFTDANLFHTRNWGVTGLKQYLRVFREPEFWIVFSKTVIWTTVSTTLQVVLGVTLAVVLHQEFIRGQKAWRLLLLLPWAIPQYITALTWRGMFQGDGGVVNSFLGSTFG